ncbi:MULTISPECIES: protocatechuate 3,4-dioxygenase subunit alpha [unclassified Rhizobium]|uniref:protocatechuate 3,4-dioxygenase subunit alpha n=1 Tax=unclassified Rhizobium TaxID=2613769 RepID=UPI000EA8A5C2|nr:MULTISPECIES: protocatechuate 3,4-dioxygenase subunit alpha [unclassified Rhizobium]AYG69431.1 protocatechuate 3,4-dioxygenase subunit alpha [Rhizobium sp. CCGE531]AYG75810.1 protocatechuate 3,4-dioxygenase subunit alpha [Rhizobium sp. CCGE532]
MVQDLGYLKETPSQTAGPYVHIGLTPNYSEIGGVYETDLGSVMVNDKTLGEHITVTGRVIDGAGAPVKDAVLEIWQADSAGLYNSPSELRGTADPNFTGWGRCPTSSTDGVFRFGTIKPGRVPFKDGREMAPHITVWIVARGINIGLHTRMYFPEETEANAEDPLLARIEHRDRLATLIAAKEGSVYTFDIHLQGDKETVFLDI